MHVLVLVHNFSFLILYFTGMSMASPQYSDTNGDHYQNRDIIPRRTSSSRHQPTPKILSSDQVFRAEEGETLGKGFII